ncbi:MAG: hypothetical protein HYX72_01755 [Acidobacteria bacterium]|nr:hypothetical protein [Acidobacteriota bacterium]
MNCEEFEREFANLEHLSDDSAALEAHRASCRSCAGLVSDVKFITAEARQMTSSSEPSGRVWRQIHSELQKSGLIKEPRQTVFAPAPAFGWFPRMSMGLAYAAVFVIALGVVYIYSILAPRVATPALPQPPNPPFAQVFEKIPPQQRSTYVNHLNQVDASIEQLKAFLAAHPEDPFARQELFTTYQQKSRLWEDLVRWHDFSESTAPPAIPEAIPASSQP